MPPHYAHFAQMPQMYFQQQAQMPQPQMPQQQQQTSPQQISGHPPQPQQWNPHQQFVQMPGQPPYPHFPGQPFMMPSPHPQPHPQSNASAPQQNPQPNSNTEHQPQQQQIQSPNPSQQPQMMFPHPMMNPQMMQMYYQHHQQYLAAMQQQQNAQSQQQKVQNQQPVPQQQFAPPVPQQPIVFQQIPAQQVVQQTVHTYQALPQKSVTPGKQQTLNPEEAPEVNGKRTLRNQAKPKKIVINDEEEENDFGQEVQNDNDVQMIDTNPSAKQKPKKIAQQPQELKNQTILNQYGAQILFNPDPNVRFQPIYEAKNNIDEEILCDICRDETNDDDDEIVLCDMCNTAVHQSCYGQDIKDDVPEGQWFCQRCTYLRSNPASNASSVQCRFCLSLKGMMVNDPGFGWVHHTCVNWIPNIWFKDDDKTVVDGKISDQCYKLKCYICRAPNGTGYCVQCDYKCCQRPFHIRCGIDKGLIKSWTEMNDHRENEESYECFLFCEKHLEVGKKELREGGKGRLVANTKAQIDKKMRKFYGDSLPQNRNAKGKAKSKKPQKNDDEEAEIEDEDDDVDEEDEKSNEDVNDGDASDGENQTTKKRPSIGTSQIKSKKKSKSKSAKGGDGGLGLKITQPSQQALPTQETFMNIFKQFWNSNGGQAGMPNPWAAQGFGQQQQQVPINNNDMMQSIKKVHGGIQHNQVLPQFGFADNDTGVQKKATKTKKGIKPATQNEQPVITPVQQQPIAVAQFVPPAFIAAPPQQPIQAHVNPAFVPQIPPQQPQIAPMVQQQPFFHQSPFGEPQTPAPQVPQAQPQQQTTILPPPPQVQSAQDSKYAVDPQFAQLIGMKTTVATRKDLQHQFIAFAIENHLVEASTRHYEIFKNPFLRSRFAVDKVAPNEIFKFIKSCFLKQID
ncbi:hypothetical protein FGO68_gene12006 [Halteria grandinella]|uniref:Uncharacterized protein n=1 Tax=Halteria grandinella TaxID=5974 RepID=A0A8J8P0X6_HALGN|nr:hypothetical protein FGO68_gene12006 [Halteria grandinella]